MSPDRTPLQPFLAPAGIALFGASAEPGTLGFGLLQNLKGSAFAERVHLVSARHGEIAGYPCHAALADIQARLTLAVVASPAVTVTGPIVDGTAGSPLLYAPVIEDGRTPGKPISIEGVTNIGLWARRKLRVAVGKAQTAAGQAINYFFVGFPIARGIKARGFAPPYQKGLGMVRNTIKYAGREIESRLRAAVDAYARAWGADNRGGAS